MTNLAGMSKQPANPDAARPNWDKGLAAAAQISEMRLATRIAEMAEIGATPKGGVCRLALTPEDAAVRAQLAGWAIARGFSVATDPIGNLFIRRAGTDPDADPILTGSHLDSQPLGGRFDGVYGVLAGFEVLEALEDAGIATRRPIETVAWTNEEGARFQPGCMGSAAFAGAYPLAEMLACRDGTGMSVADALRSTVSIAPPMDKRPLGFPVAGYVEAHIEQGPRLEAESRTIGVVTGIQGSRWFQVDIVGEEAHAGTTPHGVRKDAFKAAVSMVAALEQVMADPDDIVRFTVGRFTSEPGSPNTVPGRVSFTIDFRHPSAEVVQRLGDLVAPTCQANARNCDVTVRETFAGPPVDFSAGVIDLVQRSADQLGLSSMVMPSGANHDAKFMARLAPTGMVFIPCARGISHNEAEDAAISDCAAGARVLAATLVALADA